MTDLIGLPLDAAKKKAFENNLSLQIVYNISKEDKKSELFITNAVVYNNILKVTVSNFIMRI